MKTLSKLLLLFLFVSITSLTSCKSDEDNNEEDKPDGIALKESFIQNRKDAMQEFDLDISSGGTITGSQGTKVYFPPNSLGLSGSPVSGNVKVELIEIYGKSSMVLQNKSTKGTKPNGDEEALNSAGEFFINAKQNGTQLEVLSPISVDSKPINSDEIEAMNIFKAGDNLEDENLWEEVDQNEDGVVDGAAILQGEDPVTYEIFDYFNFPINDFGWTNLDKWYSYTGLLTDLFVDVPDGYNATNCLVYLSYDGETGLANMDKWDTNQEMFTEHFGRIPVGQQVHFIMVARIGNVMNYAIQPATIVDGHVEVISNLQPISDADLTTLLNALP